MRLTNMDGEKEKRFNTDFVFLRHTKEIHLCQ